MKYITDIVSENLIWCHPIDVEVAETVVIYGLLYNWYAVVDVRKITSFGWHVPTYNDFEILVSFLGGESVAGGKLKEIGITHWLTPNTDATNEYGLTIRGSGLRWANGDYESLQEVGTFWSSTDGEPAGDEFVMGLIMSYDDGGCSLSYFNNPGVGGGSPKNLGSALRSIKDSTSLSHGEIGTYVGNDGKVYATICIGTQEWVSSNLTETKYRDGTSIPEVTNQAAWDALTTGALCAYNNDWANAIS